MNLLANVSNYLRTVIRYCYGLSFIRFWHVIHNTQPRVNVVTEIEKSASINIIYLTVIY